MAKLTITGTPYVNLILLKYLLIDSAWTLFKFGCACLDFVFEHYLCRLLFQRIWNKFPDF